VDFEALVNQHKDAVYRQMVRVCGNREDAEDVLILALVRAWRRLDQLADEGAFRSWLAQIGRRVCWNLRNREAVLPLLQLSGLPAGGDYLSAAETAMEARLDAARMKQTLHGAIEALPEIYREVYRMRDIEEVPGDEAARRLGIGLASMKSRLFRARALLRERLDRELLKGADHA
jgi:RNA polymerase sigma-70 factor (ECF subfamily)